jgi:hypothetical protein
MTEKFNHSGRNHISERIAHLIDAYLRQSITPDEHDELDDWVGASDDNMRVFEEKTGSNNNPLKEQGNKKYSSIWNIPYYRPMQYG